MKDLAALRRELISELPNEMAFSFINTRLILRTGVDLSKAEGGPGTDDQFDRVASALKDMGYLRGQA